MYKYIQSCQMCIIMYKQGIKPYQVWTQHETVTFSRAMRTQQVCDFFISQLISNNLHDSMI